VELATHREIPNRSSRLRRGLQATLTDQLIALLRRPDGASIEEMVDALGWLPHTARAALTGLKKKGHAIVRDKAGSVTVYKVSA
jgi:predicted ArsR family transcriptional regulator